MVDYLSMERLQAGGIYRLKSRNLAFGVWLPDKLGFSGIREKFWHRYLFTEYHYDAPSFATARPLEFIETVPEGVDLVEHYSGCKVCRELVDFDVSRGETRQERWCHVDKALDQDHQAEAIYWDNEKLWNALERVESAEAQRKLDDGTLWRGNGYHHFTLTPVGAKEGRAVVSQEYFLTQRELGVCMGVHHFTTPHLEGRVHLDYERPSLGS